MPSKPEQDSSSQNSVAVWLGIGVVLGGVMTGVAVYLALRDRRQTGSLQGLPPGPSYAPVNVWNVIGQPPASMLPMLAAGAAQQTLLPGGVVDATGRI